MRISEHKMKAPAEAGALEKDYESGWKGDDIHEWNKLNKL